MSWGDDYNFLMFLTGGVGPCSLDRSPKSNWVQKNGGLPNYICHIARAIAKNGHSIQSAIPMAIGTAKRWAAGGTTNGTARAKHVHSDTAAKAAAAVAQWEALRARAHAGHVVKASHPAGGQYLFLTDVGSFNTDMVRQAWDARKRDLDLWGSYIVQLWSDHVIAEVEDEEGTRYVKVPYSISGNLVSFEDPIPVVQTFTPLPGWKPADDPDKDGDDDRNDPDDDGDNELTEDEEQQARDENPYRPGYSPLTKITEAAGY